MIRVDASRPRGRDRGAQPMQGCKGPLRDVGGRPAVLAVPEVGFVRVERARDYEGPIRSRLCRIGSAVN